MTESFPSLATINVRPHKNQPVTMSEKNKALVHAFVEAINEQDWPRLRGLVGERFVRHSVAAGESSVQCGEALVAFLKMEFSTFPDARETLLDLVAENDKVAARHQFRGTQLGSMGPYPASGRVLNATYLAIYRIENERIVEAWAEWDNLAGLKQLGHHSAA